MLMNQQMVILKLVFIILIKPDGERNNDNMKQMSHQVPLNVSRH